MAKVNYVKKARKDYPESGMKKGDSYYWWKFNFSTVVHKSKMYPKPSQTTNSSFLKQLFQIQEQIADNCCATIEDFDNFKESLISDLESLCDERRDSLDNMPQGLQSGQTGELLQSRIDFIENLINDIQAIEVEETYIEDGRDDDGQRQIELQQAIDTAIDELQELSFECE